MNITKFVTTGILLDEDIYLDKTEIMMTSNYNSITDIDKDYILFSRLRVLG